MGGKIVNPIFPLEFLVPVLLAVGVATWVMTFRATRLAPIGIRVWVLLLRGLVVLLLSLLALNLGEWRSDSINIDSEWVLLVDRSESMTTKDEGRGSRWNDALRLIKHIQTLEDQRGRLKIVSFAGQVDPESDVDSLQPDGAGTDIAQAATHVLNQYAGGNPSLAGVLLMSDGRVAGGLRDDAIARRYLARNVPLHAMVLGGEVERKDLEVNASTRQVVRFAGQTLRIQGKVRNDHMGDLRVPVQLLDADGTVLDQQDVEVADGREADVNFSVPEREAVYEELTLRVAPWPGETLTHNNSVQIGVSQLDRSIRILLVEGEPHWDNKFLIQLLRAQPHMEVTTVHRVTSERFFRVLTSGVRCAGCADHLSRDAGRSGRI